ncbi:MAG TPA: DNA polymerase, partial [Erysipelothrix sp.]|nr:DNA polymerase [Erysipelothrix sp.]
PLYRFILDNNLDLKDVYFDDLTVLSFIVDGSNNTFDKVKDAFNLWYHDLDEESQMLKTARSFFDVWDTQMKKAKKDEVDKVYLEIERPLTKVLAKSEYYGFRVNQEKLDEIAQEKQSEIESLTQQVHELVGEPFNLNSPKQLSEILFDKLELPMIKKRSTAVGVLEKLQDQHEIIPLILEYRRVQKLYSTYAVGLQKHIEKDGKIHTKLNQHATQTGRLSSSEPNLQNISVRDEEGRQVRSAFVASEGYRLMSIDYSQIELRVLSFLAQEEKMMDAFNQNEDIHTQTAKDIFHVDSVSENERREAKSVNFGIIYGMQAYGLSEQLGISVADASDYIKRYHTVYPNISHYMNKQIELCQEKGYVTTFFKRRRFIPEIHDSNRALREFGKRAAMNAPIQGTAADIIKMAMVKVDAFLEDKKSKMILQVHDELVLEVHMDELELIEKEVVKIMENIVDWPIDLKVSVNKGPTWLEA